MFECCIVVILSSLFKRCGISDVFDISRRAWVIGVRVIGEDAAAVIMVGRLCHTKLFDRDQIEICRDKLK